MKFCSDFLFAVVIFLKNRMHIIDKHYLLVLYLKSKLAFIVMIVIEHIEEGVGISDLPQRKINKFISFPGFSSIARRNAFCFSCEFTKVELKVKSSNRLIINLERLMCMFCMIQVLW